VLGQPYEVPATSLCASCHDGSADRLLGVEALSLGLPSAQGLTLEALTREGWLSAPPTASTMSLPEDDTGKAAAALGWLHVNCGVACHNENDAAAARFSGLFLKLAAADGFGTATEADGGAPDGGDAGRDAGADAGRDGGLAPSSPRVRATAAWRTAANVTPRMPDYAADGFLRLAPGNADKTLLLALAALPRTSPVAMPLVGPSTHDQAGLAALRAWLDALPRGELPR
jgi:hypothetical protein